MRPALTFSSGRVKATQCIWHNYSSTQCIEQFFNKHKRHRPFIKITKPPLFLFSRPSSSYNLKPCEDNLASHEIAHLEKLDSTNKDQIDDLLVYLSKTKLSDPEIFAHLRTALYSTPQYDYQKAWKIYKGIVAFNLVDHIKPNHYGALLCILKFGPSPFHLLKVIERMKKHAIPNNYHYSQSLYALQRFGLTKYACRHIKTIPDPKPNHYHSLIMSLKKCENINAEMVRETAEIIISGMQDHNVELDHITRTLTITLLADYKQSDIIVKFLKSIDQIQQKKAPKQYKNYNIYMYTSLIAGCARQADSVGAKMLFEEIKKQKLKPNQVTYTALIEAYGRAGDFTSAIRLLISHQKKYKKVNNSMLTSLIVNALRHDMVDIADKSIEFMTKKNVKLEETDGVLRAAILWLKTKRDVDSARRYFDKLYLEDKKYVNNVMINHLVKKYGEKEDKKNVIETYAKHLDLPINLTQQENLRAKHYLVDALFHCRDVPAAIGVFISMRNQAMSDEITMAMIVKGLVLNNEGDLAWKMFKTLQSNGTEPNLHAYTSILKSLAKKSSYMKKKDQVSVDRLDPSLLKAAGIRLSELDFNHSPVPVTTEALQLFRRLTGFHEPNVYIYTTLISCFAKNNIYQAINIFEHMCSNNVNPTVETYTALIQGSAIFRNSDITYAVFKHMNDNNVKPGPLTWSYFLKALKRSGVDKKEIDVIGEYSREN